MKSGMKRTFSIAGALRATPLLLAAAIGAVCIIGCDGGGGTQPWTDPNNPGGNPGTNPGTPGGNTPARNPIKYDTLIDERDGQAYKTVKIGEQTWMAENLNANIYVLSGCYNNDPSYCDKYGRMYYWETAAWVCPSGYRLPSKKDWDDLIAHVGGKSVAGIRLSADSGWNYSKRTDDFGFSALPGGIGTINSIISAFSGAGMVGSWWTTKESGSDSIYTLNIAGSSLDLEYEDFLVARSVRCLQGEDASVTPPVMFPVTVLSVGIGAGSGTVIYPADNVGKTVSIYAGTAPVGQRFKGWTVTSGGVTLAAADSARTSFTMPANAVTLTANFETVGVETGTFTDGRDGQSYKTVKIGGGNTWMAQNLNYQTPDSSWCYGDSAANCVKYGRLYAWNAAMSACPTGWHLSTDEEWDELITTVGATDAGKRLKTESVWESYRGTGGTDDYGFSALPGGHRNKENSRFESVESGGAWWTATKTNNNMAKWRSMYFENTGVGGPHESEMTGGCSVRCVLND